MIKNIQTNLTYYGVADAKCVIEKVEHGNLERRQTNNSEEYLVTVHNGRPFRDKFTLDNQGFEFVDHNTRVRDFHDPNELKSIYYPEMEQLIKKSTGASKVLVFDHTLRAGDRKERAKRHSREPVHRVHNDNTEWSGPQRLRDILPDEADNLLKNRFSIIQTWRAIRNPIEADPLAICDATSLLPTDLISPDRGGGTYQVTYNTNHLWYYFPRMARNEILIFKGYDSKIDGCARFTAHTSFNDPTSPPNANPRESIEIRTLAFYDS